MTALFFERTLRGRFREKIWQGWPIRLWISKFGFGILAFGYRVLDLGLLDFRCCKRFGFRIRLLLLQADSGLSIYLIYLSIYLSFFLSFFLSVFLSFHRSIYLSIDLSIYLSIYLSTFIYLSIHLSVYLSIYLSIYLSFFLSIYLSFYLSTFLSFCLSV